MASFGRFDVDALLPATTIRLGAAPPPRPAFLNDECPRSLHERHHSSPLSPQPLPSAPFVATRR